MPLDFQAIAVEAPTRPSGQSGPSGPADYCECVCGPLVVTAQAEYKQYSSGVSFADAESNLAGQSWQAGYPTLGTQVVGSLMAVRQSESKRDSGGTRTYQYTNADATVTPRTYRLAIARVKFVVDFPTPWRAGDARVIRIWYRFAKRHVEGTYNRNASGNETSGPGSSSMDAGSDLYVNLTPNPGDTSVTSDWVKTFAPGDVADGDTIMLRGPMAARWFTPRMQFWQNVVSTAGPNANPDGSVNKAGFVGYTRYA